MVSTAQNLENLAIISNYIADGMGIGGIPNSQLTQAERVQFIQLLSQNITAYPANFSAATVATAQYVLGQNLNVLQGNDGQPNLAEIWVSSMLDTVLGAGQQVGDVGRGVLNLLSNTGTVLTNTGQAAANLTGSASGSWIGPVLLFGAAAVLLLNVNREVRTLVSR